MHISPSDSARRERVRVRWIAVPVAVATVSLAAACGSSGGGTPSADSKPPMASSTAGAVVSTESSKIGTILVNDTGRTIYVFANDTGTKSTCNGACAANWPPVPASSPPATVTGVSAQLGSTTRDDGSQQLTVAGHPVYTFAGDTAKGQTNGQGIQLSGGLWTAVTPAGKPDMQGLSAGASSSFSY
jgi:predicted lipoprotein with Yx(FWY)xxD motif